MSVTLYVSTMPKPGETVVNVQAPRMTNYSWTDDQRELEITTLVVGSLTIQFDNPAEARAWLTECATMLDSALAKRDPLAHVDLRTFVHPEPEPVALGGMTCTHSTEAEGYWCTQPEGHVGDHIARAWDDAEYIRWPQ